MKHTLSSELSDQETYAIGSIVSQWGFIEAEIFEQAIISFEDTEAIPKILLSNGQFSKVLEIWRERVAIVNVGGRKETLLAQYDRIVTLSEYRQAVVHSRWEWSPQNSKKLLLCEPIKKK